MRLPTFYEQNLIPNWGKTYTYKHKQVQLVDDELHPMGLDDDVSIPICLLHSSPF